ncbi:MAG: sensor histidine kinase [Bacteroidia bacterium]
MAALSKYSLLKNIRFYIIGIIVYALPQIFILHRLDINWEISIIDSCISAIVLAFYCFDLMIIFSFYQPGKGNHFYRLLFVAVFAKLNVFTADCFLSWRFQHDTSYLLFLDRSLPIRLVISFLIFMFVTAMYWMWNNLNEQREKEKRRVDMEQLAKEAELATLRQKLQPHFLFNSLNSISALAVSKPNEARKMIQQLSDFLRGTLKKDEQKVVPLKDELNHLNLYLEIEKVRFGHRLNIETQFAENSNLSTIPPLLIQPIVENAIKFGLYGTLENTTITITTFAEKNILFVRVKNPFDSNTQKENAGTGFGLSSIQRRLFLLYARNDLLITEKQENEFITTLKIPQQL